MLAGRQTGLIVFNQPFFTQSAVIQPLLHIIGVGGDILIVGIDVAFSHHKTTIPDLLQIVFSKGFLPVKRNIAAFHDQILIVFDGCLNHFPEDGPEIVRQFLIIAGCQLRLAAADQPHFQMVNGQIGIVVLFQQFLGQNCFSCV